MFGIFLGKREQAPTTSLWLVKALSSGLRIPSKYVGSKQAHIPAIVYVSWSTINFAVVLDHVVKKDNQMYAIMKVLRIVNKDPDLI